MVGEGGEVLGEGKKEGRNGNEGYEGREIERREKCVRSRRDREKDEDGWKMRVAGESWCERKSGVRGEEGLV